MPDTIPDQETSANQPAQVDDAQAKKAKLWSDIQKEQQQALEDYNTARPYLLSLVSSWTVETVRTDANRLTRDIDIDIDSLRENGDIEDDECFIPDRIIDQNIQRELPSYINFLKNSRRLAIFNDVLDATFDCQLLEDAFTKVMTYKGWIRPWYKLLDGSMSHGWASFELVYDESKPGNVGIEYIAHEDLMFAHDSKDIQASVCVLRRYRPTPLLLRTWCAKFGFDIDQVNNIIEKFKEKGNQDKTIEVYKRFYKFNGCVYVSWFTIEGNCTDWLKKPTKLYCGIDEFQQQVQMVNQSVSVGIDANRQPIIQNVLTPQTSYSWQQKEVENYPVFINYYRETEKPLLFDHIGRCFLDKDKQEMNTAVLTSFCNGCTRAMKIYASPEEDNIQDGKPAKQLANIKWSNGGIFDKPMAFWHMPYPDPMILKALQYFDVANSQDVGQTDFAATNREDSRKTATEIKAASQQSQLLDSVDLTLFSEFCREVLSFAWLIVRSQALQGKIKFLQISKLDAIPVEATVGLDQNQQTGAIPQPPQQMGALPMNGMQPQQAPAQVNPQLQQQSMQQKMMQGIVNSEQSYIQEMTGYTNDIDTLVRTYDIRAAGDVDVIQKAEMVQNMMQDWPVYSQTPLAGRFLADLTKLKYPMNGDVYTDILVQGNPKNQIIQSLGIIVQQMVKEPDVARTLTPQMTQQLQQIEEQAKQALQTP